MTARAERGEPSPPVSDLTGFTDITLAGRGAQGHVYRATKTSIGKVVALKAFPLGSGAALRERALRAEVDALVALSHHPGVVGVHDLHLRGAWAWLEMDYCAGGSSLGWAADLAHAPDWAPRAAVAALLELGGQVAQALAFAHRLGWVHGDVKPGNILLDHLGTARVGDFGLARLASAGLVPRPGYRAPGTPRYQPPEVLLEGAVPTAAGDVFALAETLRDLRRLVGGDGLAAPERVLDPDVTDTEALGTSPTEVLADLEVLLAHMSVTDPARRPRASEVADRLAALGARLASGESALSRAASPTDPATLPSPPPPTLPTTRPRRRGAVRAAVAVGVALALLGFAGGAAWLLWPDPTGGQDVTDGNRPEPGTSSQPGPTGEDVEVTSPPPGSPGAPSGGASTSAGPTTGGSSPPAGGEGATVAPPPVAPSSSADGVTYAWPAGLLTPQLLDGNCVFTIFYGQFGDAAFAKVRFYSGDCGGTTLILLGRGDDGVIRKWGTTGSSAGEDECGRYLEIQADSGTVKSTAVGQTVLFRETGTTYTFTAGEGAPPAVHRPC
ncbi:serine/threonine protein kinase [Frankia sp. CNm7]|uniref:non-specific serine/threonine protein kinase n=1 Tax=Frankia nepalensis TaxID=1836974 RepID=A0A937RIV1_9ACTN|nr:serine/threonine-protein kinase [Frankia nepalensis]MBL7495154.1 serine/threonine protein kinase [Frankia nepalensis]MBL7509885.1 serine/threonine protein kinase [Frankia nepalensis]MBL7520677.1 serine/threonine protein kinase [Frankia nepalensis]MBL7629644.1 serine/threonine protein kinase [Frankia nepalensis]